jgi:hypothetical protein
VACDPQLFFGVAMKTQIDSTSPLKNILLYAAVYLLWFLNTLVCVAVVIQLQSIANVFWIALGGDRYTLSFISQVSILLGGLVAFVYVMFLESYYRGSITRQVEKTPSQHQNRFALWLTNLRVDVLLRRFAISTAIPIGVLVACLVAFEIALRILR